MLRYFIVLIVPFIIYSLDHGSPIIASYNNFYIFLITLPFPVSYRRRNRLFRCVLHIFLTHQSLVLYKKTNIRFQPLTMPQILLLYDITILKKYNNTFTRNRINKRKFLKKPIIFGIPIICFDI